MTRTFHVNCTKSGQIDIMHGGDMLLNSGRESIGALALVELVVPRV